MNNKLYDPEVEEGFKLWYGQSSNFPVSNAYNDPEFYRNIKRSFDKTQNINASDIETTEKSTNKAKAQEKGNALLQPTYLMANEHKTYIGNIDQNSISKFPPLNPVLCASAQNIQGRLLNWGDEFGGMAYGLGESVRSSPLKRNPLNTYRIAYPKGRDIARDFLQSCVQQYPKTSKIFHDIGSVDTQLTLTKASKTAGLISIPLYYWGEAQGDWKAQRNHIIKNTGWDTALDIYKQKLGMPSISPYIDTFTDKWLFPRPQ